MILLEGFLVRLMIGITKNPSRRIINVTFLSRRTRLYLNVTLVIIFSGLKSKLVDSIEKFKTYSTKKKLVYTAVI